MNILRLMNVHNESDILEYNLDWYVNQGIDIVAIDNCSTDNSSKILKSRLGKGVVEVKHIYTDHFDRELLFTEISKLGNKYSPDWIVFADSDEFYEPQSKEFKNLYDMIKFVDSKGDNLIQFHNCEFWMTPEDDFSIKNPIERMKHYSYFDSNRFKAFKFYKGFSLTPQRGHAPTLPEGIEIKISSNKGISRHYKFRNLDQAQYKVKRVVPEEDKLDFGFHYVKFGNSSEYYIIPRNKLNQYNEDSKWILERKFDGNRMSDKELCSYLGLKSKDELEKWFEFRKGVFKCQK